ncbi:MAG: hypothetical protein K2O03_02175 [Lachnospiraceae bacterium]|nr:hypothetical protein [Lachnospiraceae bacterium]
MDEKEILSEEKASCIPDDTDRRIMQALSDELSEITVSKELFERTLSAAKEQKNGKKKKAGRGQRFAGRMFAAAAAVLVIALGAELVQNAGNTKKNSGNKMAEGDFSDGIGYVQNAGEDWQFSSSASGSEGEGYCGDADASLWDGADVKDGSVDEPLQEPEQGGEWLYRELLAAFDAAGGAEDAVSDADGVAEEPPLSQESEGKLRSISWQRDGKELSCVIYGEDYRIVAVLWENGKMQSLELKDWVYAPQLWEMAVEQ